MRIEMILLSFTIFQFSRLIPSDSFAQNFLKLFHIEKQFLETFQNLDRYIFARKKLNTYCSKYWVCVLPFATFQNHKKGRGLNASEVFPSWKTFHEGELDTA